MAVDCLISFGSNLGDRGQVLEQVVQRLTKQPGLERVAVSRPVETQPVGGRPKQPPYLNAAIRFATERSPNALHRRLMEIEQELGRQRRRRWDSRTVDLDLLLCGESTIQSAGLILPHPRMSFRRFVLEPAVEIAAQMRHPICRQTLSQLLERLNQAPNVIRVVGRGVADFRQTCQPRLLARSVGVESSREASNSNSGGSQNGPERWIVTWGECSGGLSRSHEKTKLLVCIHRSDESSDPLVETCVAAWRGPRLDLCDPSADELVIELNAAIQAMSRQYRHSPWFDVK